MKLRTEKIKGELMRLGKNQSWLAREVGMTRAGISYILKTGKVKLTTIDKIAAVLDFDAKDLLE